MFSSNTTQVSSDAAYIEDVFSTYLYTGNASTLAIANGVDLSTYGGLVWIKKRDANISDTSHALIDTARGKDYYLNTNNNGPSSLLTNILSSFNTNGFTLSDQGGLATNNTNNTYVSWTFREQPKFFDIVTYTGNGANRTIAHNLGSVPGCIMVKRTDTTGDWQVYHRSLANTQYLVLNSTAAAATGATRWNSTTPTATEFSLGTDATVNASGGTYVAYLFAHDAGGFGATGADNVISCGSFTSSAGGLATVNLGYEPQWVMFKGSNGVTNWQIVDNMRGFVVGAANSGTSFLNANTAAAEGTNPPVGITNTGFNFDGAPNINYIYIAIRRGPMRTPTSGTSVFETIARSGTSSAVTVGSLQAVDWSMTNCREADSQGRVWFDRLRGQVLLRTNSTAAEESNTNVAFDVSQGIRLGSDGVGTTVNQSGATYSQNNFRRAPGFFDVVCYTGTGVAGRTVNHNLAVVPELMIVKRRDLANNWAVYSASLGNNSRVFLNQTQASAADSSLWNDTTPTNSVFTVGTAFATNNAGNTYVAYLFASCPGVSKVGSFTGTGNTQTINCDFSSGARFVLIKRTDSTGDWYVWDSARGIVAGNDPYLLLNSTAAEVTNTDWVDTAASGFELSNAGGNLVNINGASYIFLSVA